VCLLLASEFSEWDACVFFHRFSLFHVKVGEVPDEVAHLTGLQVVLGWCVGGGAGASVGWCACCCDVGPILRCEVVCLR